MSVQPLTGQRLDLTAEILPQIALAPKSIKDIADGVAIRLEVRIVQLAPIERRRHWRAGARSDRIRWCGGLRVGIPRRVDEDSTPSLHFAHLNREMFGIGVGELGLNIARERTDVVEGCAPIQWDEHVQPTRPGALDERMQVLSFEELTKGESGPTDRSKVAA